MDKNNREAFSRASEEREIRLGDMLWKILYGWRGIVICALVFTLLLGGYSYLSSSRAAKAQKTTLEQSKEQQAEEQKKALTEEELKAVDQARVVQEQIAVKQAYAEDSVAMNLDPYHQKCRTLQYYVDTHYSWNINADIKDNPASDIVKGYSDYINFQGLLNDIKDSVKWEEDISFLGELIYQEGLRSGYQSAPNTFELTVTGRDEKEIDQLADAAQKAIEAQQAVIAEKIADHDLILVDTNDRDQVNTELADKQKLLDKDIMDLQTQFKTLTANFKPEQQQLLGIEFDEEEGEEEEEEETEVQIIQPGVSAKYVLLGFVLGAFLYAAWIGVLYVFDKRLKSSKECQEIYGIRIFGSIAPKERGEKKFLGCVDRWLQKKQGLHRGTKEEREALLLTNLSVTCRKDHVKKLLLTSSAYLDEEAKQSVEMILQSLRGQGVDASFHGDIIHNAESLEQMSEIGTVVFVEEAGVTTYEDMETQMLLCMEQEASVLGLVMIEQS